MLFVLVVADLTEWSNVVVDWYVLAAGESFVEFFVDSFWYECAVFLGYPYQHYEILLDVVSGVKIAFTDCFLNGLAEKFWIVFLIFVVCLDIYKVQGAEHQEYGHAGSFHHAAEHVVNVHKAWIGAVVSESTKNSTKDSPAARTYQSTTTLLHSVRSATTKTNNINN